MNAKQKFEQFWNARTPSEQKFLQVWVVVIAAAAVYFLLLSPLSGRIGQLQKNVPKLESQLFAMRSQPVPGGTRSGQAAPKGDLRSVLFQLLANKGVNVDLRSISAERVELRLPEMPATEALALADHLRQEAAARITILSIKKGAGNGFVQMIVEMERGR